jgi:hypothetical protein
VAENAWRNTEVLKVFIEMLIIHFFSGEEEKRAG